MTKISPFFSLSPSLISSFPVFDRSERGWGLERSERKGCSHDLLRSRLLSVDCRAANFNLAGPVIRPKINASFEKWKSNCPDRRDDWRWLQTNCFGGSLHFVWLLSLAHFTSPPPTHPTLPLSPFSLSASRLSYSFSAGKVKCCLLHVRSEGARGSSAAPTRPPLLLLCGQNASCCELPCAATSQQWHQR